MTSWSLFIQLEELLDKDAVCHRLYWLIERVLYQGCSWGFGNLKKITKEICTARYAEDLVLLAKEQNDTTERD